MQSQARPAGGPLLACRQQPAERHTQMTKRGKTPDLMGELLSGRPAQPESQPASQTQRQKAKETDERIKATHYLRQSTLYRLEQALLSLRMSTDNRGLNRYDVVEQALQAALDDLERNGESSELARRLAQK